jgi:hypothetical protein
LFSQVIFVFKLISTLYSPNNIKFIFFKFTFKKNQKYTAKEIKGDYFINDEWTKTSDRGCFCQNLFKWWEILSCGGLDKNIYVSLFYNKTPLILRIRFITTMKHYLFSITKYYLGKADQEEPSDFHQKINERRKKIKFSSKKMLNLFTLSTWRLSRA